MSSVCARFQNGDFSDNGSNIAGDDIVNNSGAYGGDDQVVADTSNVAGDDQNVGSTVAATTLADNVAASCGQRP